MAKKRNRDVKTSGIGQEGDKGEIVAGEGTQEAAEGGKTTSKVAEVVASLTKYEKYNFVLVNRQDIKNAPYNPRQISEKARKKLRAMIDKIGLIEPLIYNKRTNHIVGGHQRLAAIDSLEGTNRYQIHMAEIDVDLKTEKEINVALNNPNMQGEYDLELLEEIYKDKEVIIENTGFDVGDVYRMFGDAPLAGRTGEMQKLAEQYRSFREVHEDLIDGLAKRDDSNYFLVVTFQDGTAREEFLTALELPNERHINGKILLDLLKPEQRKLVTAEITANCDHCDTLNAIDKGQTECVCRLCKKTFPVELPEEPKTEPETTIGTPVANNT